MAGLLPRGGVSQHTSTDLLPRGGIEQVSGGGGGDTTPPTLSSPVGTTTGATTASWSVSTNEANGTLYRLASTNASETAATVKASGGTATVTATGTQSGSVSGLTAATTYFMHFVHRDAAGNDSTVATSASFTTNSGTDTTPPVLSGSISVVGGTITQSGWQANWPAATDNVAVTGYDISTDGGSTWPTTWPSNDFTFTGFAAGTTYQLRVRARDAAGNLSSVISGSVTTLAAGATFTSEALKDGTGTVLANKPLTHFTLYSNTTGALVVRRTGLSTNGSGVVTFTDAALAAGVIYRADWLTTEGHFRMPGKAAT